MLYARLSLLLALMLGLGMIAFLVFPHVMLVWAGCLLTLRSMSERRIRCSSCITVWADRLLGLVCRILKLEIEWRMPAHIRDGELIVIANHRSSLDPVILVAVLHKLGLRNSCWIAKWQVLLAPCINLMGLAVGTIFITRWLPGTDSNFIERGAKRVREDKAKICIFPEGTRFVASRRSDGFRNVLAPKRRGFGILRRVLPQAAVLSVLFHWEHGATGNGNAKTIWSMASLYGKRLTVHVTLTEPAELEADPDWLVRTFRSWDLQLDAPA